jgi:lactoylglutathione lyase
MRIDHVAIWTNRLEELSDFYVKYLDGKAGDKYTNSTTFFESCFISFSSGARLELMRKPGIPENFNDTLGKQHLGLIHLSFGLETMDQVDEKALRLEKAGYRIIRGPRRTGDGDWEFESADPDGNRIEVMTRYIEKA